MYIQSLQSSAPQGILLLANAHPNPPLKSSMAIPTPRQPRRSTSFNSSDSSAPRPLPFTYVAHPGHKTTPGPGVTSPFYDRTYRIVSYDT
eukprot:scaffold8072_cov82-Skeletonema_menzelii.AAC.2